jgi:hypothetical protein
MKWLLVEATCAYNDTQEAIGYYVECRDENVQLPRLGLSTQPPLLGELDRELPGTIPGQYPMDRFDGTWKNMDDFLSRLDLDLAAANEKYVHQDIWGENEFLRTRVRDELFVDTSINLLTLGLYVITYDVTDMAGNEATQITRFVIVQDDSELYQNSIQQVYDGTDGTFTGGVLPHEIGGTARVASEVMELSRNRPTAASSLWGVHTPSSSAVDGLYENAYIMPFSPMDEYGRTLAQDHIPNIFMSYRQTGKELICRLIHSGGWFTCHRTRTTLQLSSTRVTAAQISLMVRWSCTCQTLAHWMKMTCQQGCSWVPR